MTESPDGAPVAGGYLPPPRHIPGKIWNELVHRAKPARWVDNWWWERSRPAQEVGSFANEGSVYGIRWVLERLVPALPPVFVFITLARLASHLDEFHMGFRSLRHHDKTLFDYPQLWERNRDGSKVFNSKNLPLDEPGQSAAAGGPLASTKQFFRDAWTERRRIPSFVLGLSLIGAGFLLGYVAGVPSWIVALVEYVTLAQQQGGSPRNWWMAAKHRSLKWVFQPQVAQAEYNARHALNQMAARGPAEPDQLRTAADADRAPDATPVAAGRPTLRTTKRGVEATIMGRLQPHTSAARSVANQSPAHQTPVAPTSPPPVARTQPEIGA